MGAVIHAERLSFRYPGSACDALCELSLDIEKGSLFGLLGPNGAGKTTLISLLMGLLAPGSGCIDITQEGVSTQAALVPQDYAFYDRLSVLENLHFFAGVQGIRQPERIAAVIDTAGLDAFRHTRAQCLSGGLKRRLNLAIGLLGEPHLLFLDEPTVGIDPQSRYFILEAIKRINAAGTTVIYSSHYMEEVQALCDEVGILDRGRFLARGNLHTLLGGDRGGQLSMGLDRAPGPALRETLRHFGEVQINGAELHLAQCSGKQLEQLFELLAGTDVSVVRVRYGHADLETLFLHLTGHQLRD